MLQEIRKNVLILCFNHEHEMKNFKVEKKKDKPKRYEQECRKDNKCMKIYSYMNMQTDKILLLTMATKPNQITSRYTWQ